MKFVSTKFPNGYGEIMRNWTRKQEIALINAKQSFYVDELIKLLKSDQSKVIKRVNFNSSTGTGKTKMMAELFNKLNDKFFIVTTLSRGQLNNQVKIDIGAFAKHDNYIVYGLQDYTKATKRTAEDIIALLPTDKDIIWIRDEGHINTNKWEEILNKRCANIVNFSATNKDKNGIVCNFTETSMLRTVEQKTGKPEDAIKKLKEIKKQHKQVKNYNPCALFRVMDNDIEKEVIKQCEKHKMKYINITVDDYDMRDICQDDNKYDVIINKFKITEGTNLKRAHVLYMDNNPKNSATKIQVIGRCRRNALLWREDIDIFDPTNELLLEQTRRCYVFFDKEETKVTEKDGELLYELCDKISVQQLTAGVKIFVKKGVLPNGLFIAELENKTGYKVIKEDEKTGFNYVDNEDFYGEEIKTVEFDNITVQLERGLLGFEGFGKRYIIEPTYRKIPLEEIRTKWKLVTTCLRWDRETQQMKEYPKERPYYIEDYFTGKKINAKVSYAEIEEELAKYVWEDNNTRCGLKAMFYPYEIIKKKLEKNKTTVFGLSKSSIKKTLENQNKRGVVYLTIHGQYEMTKYKHKELIFWKKVLESRQGNAEFFEYTYPEHINTGIRFLQEKAERDPLYFNYKHISNNREIAIVGLDKFKFVKNNWTEDSTVTSKIKTFGKFNTFISKRYEKEIETASALTFSGNNNFGFDKKCNSCLGYCVEYYAKYLLYGEKYFGEWLKQAQEEYAKEMQKGTLQQQTSMSSKNYHEAVKVYIEKRNEPVKEINDSIIVRACVICYKENMVRTFGPATAYVLPKISVEKLLEDDYKDFVNTVARLGRKAFEFLSQELGIEKNLKNEDKIYDTNLSVNHISGLADFVSKNKIIDLKCTSNIKLEHIKQVLAYHYLSTFRDDLDIKQVIVYDAVSGKHIKVDVGIKQVC